MANSTSSDHARRDDIWSVEYCIDQLFLRLVSVNYEVQNDGQTVFVRKYLEQARELMRWIPVAKPAPTFVIDLSDLTRKLTSELALSPRRLQHYILVRSVGRIFEEVNFEYHHLSVARRLRVELQWQK